MGAWTKMHTDKQQTQNRQKIAMTVKSNQISDWRPKTERAIRLYYSLV